MAELKQRKCKACKTPFTPARSTQTACGIDCAMQLAHEKSVKLAECDRLDTVRKDRVRKERLKTRRDWEKEAQAAFNAFIRARDKDMPCICCGLPLSAGDVGGAYDCGHYRSVGSAPHLRFHEDNAHAQRKQCNRWGAGRAVDYRLGLIERIGLARVEAIEVDQTPRKYTADELKAIRDKYRAKARELKREAASV
jgi:hypothetical protein